MGIGKGSFTAGVGKRMQKRLRWNKRMLSTVFVWVEGLFLKSFWSSDFLLEEWFHPHPPKGHSEIHLKPPTTKITANLSLGSDFILEFHGLFLPLFCFLLGFGGKDCFPPHGVWPSPSHPHVPEGHEICRWPLGRGGAGPPKPVGETWRRKRDGRTFFQWRVDTYDRCHFAKGGEGGYGYTVCSHVKKCQICRNFLKGFGEWWNYEIDQMVKCFSSLHCCAFGGHSLQLLAAAIANWQDAEEGKNDGTVQGERCLLHAICFCFRRTNMFLCVKTRCNYSKWRAMMIPARD